MWIHSEIRTSHDNNIQSMVSVCSVKQSWGLHHMIRQNCTLKYVTYPFNFPCQWIELSLWTQWTGWIYQVFFLQLIWCWSISLSHLRCNLCKMVSEGISEVWKVSKYGVFSGPYFPAFGLNTERYEVFLRIQSKCGKIRTRKNSVFGHFSCRAGFQGWF